MKVWEGVPEKQKPESERFDENVCKFTNLDEKHLKLKGQLDVVLENILLANEMIDGCDPRDDMSENEPLIDVITSIQNMETKLENLCFKLKNEEVMNYLLKLNDDLKQTIMRYQRLKKGNRPAKFNRTCIWEEDAKKIVKQPSPQKP